jgi:hypothetical protein
VLGDALRQLAVRHAEELAKLSGNGETFTVKVSVQRGPVKFDTTEPAYNQPQVMFLVGKSDTANASALLVQYVKGSVGLLDGESRFRWSNRLDNSYLAESR